MAPTRPNRMQSNSPHNRTDMRSRRRRRSRIRVVFVSAAALLVALAVAAVYFAVGLPKSSQDSEAAAPGAYAPPDPRPVATVEHTVAPDPEASRPATITISAVGDMIFDRRVKELIRASGGAAPLRHVADLLGRADLTVGNLESPLSDGGTMDADKDVTFRGDPRAIIGLTASGFDFLSIANNHVLDYGPDALADTVSALGDAGIAHAGAGADRDAAWKPAVIELDGGTTAAYLAFSHILPPGFVATSSKAGLAQGRNNMDNVTEAVRSAKKKYDYVLVSFHWGVEYKDDANGDQVRDARATIDAGADMVLAHHPHVIQGIEFYKGRLIAYSLGDFVFDHYSRKTGEAFVLNASLGPGGVTDVSAIPVYLDTYGAPKLVQGSEATVILERLTDISAKHGTNVKIRDNRAQVLP
ncbi:MAG: CapA family protein [Actinomycetota bacterium]|nr:CapA family protein [Actinomycetota bacterium]